MIHDIGNLAISCLIIFYSMLTHSSNEKQLELDQSVMTLHLHANLDIKKLQNNLKRTLRNKIMTDIMIFDPIKPMDYAMAAIGL